MRALKIGQVARQAGVGVETVRFYEREGLLDQPTRLDSGYRQYDEEAVARLRFIRRAKDLGFTLKEIKELFELSQDPDATPADVRRRATAKIADVEARVRDLHRIQEALRELVNSCSGHGPLESCPILRALEGPHPEDDPSPRRKP